MSSESNNNNVKNETKAQKPKSRMLSAAEIKARMGISDTGDFPSWALEEYKDTHNLRWISPRKFYQHETEIDERGFEVVKDPRTGKVVKWGEMTLGAMPKDLAEERKKEVRELTKVQEDTIKDTMASREDQLRYQLKQAGYDSPRSKSTTPSFSYQKSKR